MLNKEQFFGMYIEKEIYTSFSNKRGILEGILKNGDTYDCWCRINNKPVNLDKIEYCKLILRPFEYGEMTKAEIEHYERLCGEEDEPMLHIVDTPQSIKYLISIGIDVFNLKERDWAVYESEVGK